MEMKSKKRYNWFNTYFSKVNKSAFWTCLTISTVLITVSFFVPPMAVIDSSVIAATGELFAFAALATLIDGIEKGKSVKIHKGDTTMTLNDENENEIE